MKRSLRVVLATLLVAGGAGAVVVSRHTSTGRVDRAAGAVPITAAPGELAIVPVLDDGPPPPVQGGAGWLNAPSPDGPFLSGTVVLYEFFDVRCANCQHVDPYVVAWYDRYHADGLEIVAIHTPELIEDIPSTEVAAYLLHHRITYPVVLDPDRVIWRAWDNHAWPSFSLYDEEGRLRHHHIGEGQYAATEDAIRALLGVDPASPRAEVLGR
ncbi:MAG: redoxin domain-containing protein [Acidimicrobiaceae bacterium]|nr:redoxin domain-containing protein [Ilumatobacter sp.]MCB9381144.1 redoxin domain-containing protein [Acidimicrobiaceae bacterium]MCO5331594.1 redoxin domain-containing protein [Ilumatobacteraceae bacterium]